MSRHALAASRVQSRVLLALLFASVMLLPAAPHAIAAPGSGGGVARSPVTAHERREASFDALLRRIGVRWGAVAFSDLAGGDPTLFGQMHTAYAWSTIKPLVLLTLINRAGGAGRLTAGERADAKLAITISDNGAVKRLFAALSRRAGGSWRAARMMESTLRRAGDRGTRVTLPFFGLSRWGVSREARFMSALARGCLASRSSTRFLLGLMARVTPSQRWGLGRIRGTSFKGGWGPRPGGMYLVRQMGLLRDRSGRPLVAVAIAVRPASGSFSLGSAQLDRIAYWASSHIPSAPAVAGCRARAALKGD